MVFEKLRKYDFAVIVPMANEENDFHSFVGSMAAVLDQVGCGKVYFIVDNASHDNTLQLCNELSGNDNRFVTVWSPQNKNVVEAYIAGYRAALKKQHAFIIEMDAGLSHDPKALPLFLRALDDGFECAFGSRFIRGGSISNANLKRIFLSRGGTVLSNLLLGTRLHDMTSGYQGFHLAVVKQFADYPLLSKAHFYQTELRYLLRKKHFTEIPIHYTSPSPRVTIKAVFNSFNVLLRYFYLRILNKAPFIQ